jgi:uncharacterized protein (DUF2384 family)
MMNPMENIQLKMKMMQEASWQRRQEEEARVAREAQDAA